MGGRGASSGNTTKKMNNGKNMAEAHSNFKINRIVLAADTKGAVRFQLEGNGTPFRMTKNDNDTYTIKSRNRIYGKNVTADQAKEILIETQKRFRRINESFKNQKLGTTNIQALKPKGRKLED